MTESILAEPSPPSGPGAEKTKGPGSTALDWWRHYCDPATADPGVRAQLRRCDSPIDAAATPAAVALARRLGAFAEGTDDWRVYSALNLARVLAHVREHAPGAPMRAAGWDNFGDWDKPDAKRPALSEARFRRLLTTGPDEEQVTAFVRLVAVLDGAVDVAALSVDFLDWNHPWRGEQVRKRWAVDYYAARVFNQKTDDVQSSVSHTPSPTESDA